MKNEVAASTIKAERLQTRASTNSDYIDELAERMASGDNFPSIVVFTDGKESWLADGIHRLDAAIQAKKKIGVDYRKGTRADAVAFACGANAAHGLRRTNADKRRSVTLAVSAFPDHSSRAIADLCGVGHPFVEEVRKVVSDSTCRPGQPNQPVKTRVGRDGKRQPAEKTAATNGKPATDKPTAKADSFEPKELEAERDPAPQKDEWGAPIQKHAKKAFEAVPRFDEILKLLRQASRLYTQLAEQEGGKRLQQSGVSVNARNGFRHAGIVNAIRDLEDNKPTYTICPYSVNEHQKHDKDCTLCRGLNWSPKIPKDRVPERLITKAQKQACSS